MIFTKFRGEYEVLFEVVAVLCAVESFSVSSEYVSECVINERAKSSLNLENEFT